MRKVEKMARKRTLEDELRLKAYLNGATLHEKEFSPSFPKEYALCVFCWGHISGRPREYGEGFHTEESDDWICPDCFEKYAAHFEWKMIPMKGKTFAEFLAEEEELEVPII